MRRPLLILALMLLASAAVFVAGQHLAARWCLSAAARSADDLDWLRMEFRLTETELARIRQFHQGYVPQCRRYCERIHLSSQQLQTLLNSPKTNASVIEQKLIEIGTLRGQCQSAMLQHFRQVSEVMPPEQGRRYLAEMQRLTLGSHEHIERTMAPASSPHGHH